MTEADREKALERLTDRKCAEAFARIHEGPRWQVYGGSEKEELTDKAEEFLKRLRPAFELALSEYNSPEEAAAMAKIEAGLRLD